ncbi:MAG TPA: hypothetical protein VNS63_05225 [Blastocatellia bacterium]|nr:hypothetical protein [Blastocatellia bacterium]
MDPEKENKLDDFLQLVSKRFVGGAAPKFIECLICQCSFPESISSFTVGRCLECAIEIEFGVIPSLAPKSVGGGTPFYYRSDDDDPMLDNRTRIREGD